MLRDEKRFFQQRHENKKRSCRNRIKAACILVLFFFAGARPGMAQTEGQLAPLHFTLKEAVATSLQKSREISLARLQYQTSREEAGLSRSQFLPNLYTGSGVAYTSGFPLLAGGGAPALFNLTYNQELFNLPARGDVRAGEQKAEEQRLTIDAVRDGVIQ